MKMTYLATTSSHLSLTKSKARSLPIELIAILDMIDRPSALRTPDPFVKHISRYLKTNSNWWENPFYIQIVFFFLNVVIWLNVWIPLYLINNHGCFEQVKAESNMSFSDATSLFVYLSHPKSHSSSSPFAIAWQYTERFKLTLILKKKTMKFTKFPRKGDTLIERKYKNRR